MRRDFTQVLPCLIQSGLLGLAITSAPLLAAPFSDRPAESAAIGSQFAGNAANNLLVGANNEGHASSTTQSAVSDGALIIRDQDKQQQNVDDLSRDVEHANQTLSPIFDKEKEQNRLKTAQLIGEVGSQAADIARTEGDIRSLTAGKAELAAKGEKEPGKDATKKEWKDYNDKVQATDSYKAAQKQWGTGSAIQQGISAATAAVQGLAGGDLHAAVAGGLSPYLAEQIHKLAPDEASRAMAHYCRLWDCVPWKLTHHDEYNFNSSSQ